MIKFPYIQKGFIAKDPDGKEVLITTPYHRQDYEFFVWYNNFKDYDIEYYEDWNPGEFKPSRPLTYNEYLKKYSECPIYIMPGWTWNVYALIITILLILPMFVIGGLHGIFEMFDDMWYNKTKKELEKEWKEHYSDAADKIRVFDIKSIK
jgi:hypothetical protein